MRHAFLVAWVCGAVLGCGGENDRRRDAGRGADARVEADAPSLDAPRDAPITVDAGDLCGDGRRGVTEPCDDGNLGADDGCSPTCAIEEGWRCPPGLPCRRVVCGDGRIELPEFCDDGNAGGGDGCGADCGIEAGWSCPIAGVACGAERCGDGLLAGFEQCDDANALPSDGCSAGCRLEEGFVCRSAGVPCEPTTCGDGTREGTEQCDDGNVRAYDGCDPFCRNEPSCRGGACAARCGDGVVLPGTSETCDDGNTDGGDGCSAGCTIESGFSCALEPVPLPEALRLPTVYRDFRGVSQTGAPTHPDFDARGGSGITFGMVSDFLDGEGRPAFSGVVFGGSGALDGDSFRDWYRDSARNRAVLDFLTLTRAGTSYGFETGEFFPIDERGFDVSGSATDETYSAAHNYSFSTEVHTWFEYQGDEVLTFSGDDDVWVFVDGRLCLDVGGLHPPVSEVMSFASPGAAATAQNVAIVTACRARLTVGRIYELVVFHAERRCCGSNFRLTLNGFESQVSSCEPVCGDGVVTRFELCDDGPGMNTGAYGRCGPDCLSRGGYCGDGLVEPGVEACDLGSDMNDGRYGGCNPDCTLGPTCGDGIPQPGEQCDAGEANGTPGSPCGADCVLVLM
jgi:fibro-slime domain-containing protein